MPVLVHDCKYRPESDDGRPFKQYTGPTFLELILEFKHNNKQVLVPSGRGGCDCVREISKDKAQELVDRGLAVWKKQLNTNGWVVEGHGEIILLTQHPLHAQLPTQMSHLRRNT